MASARKIMMTKLTKYTVGLVGLLMLLAIIAGIAWAVNANRSTTTVSYSYDHAGRLTQADYGDGAIGYTYDNNGNLLERIVSGEAAEQSLFLPIISRD